MFEAHLAESDRQSKNTHPQQVVCSQHKCEAEIVVATWPYSEEGWSGWRVVDCSLMPTGAVRCGMDCLSQARASDE